MTFNDLVQALSEKVKVDLTIEDGTISMTIDDMPVVVTELPELESLVLVGEICEPPPQGLEKLYATILEAHHNFAGTAGATISRNPENGKFHLCRCLQLAATDGDTFVEAIEKFANTLETWKNVITSYREDKSLPNQNGNLEGDPMSGISNDFIRI